MGHIFKPSAIPTVDEYVSGLSAIRSRINESQVRLLQEQYYAPNRTATATQLAELIGIESGRGAINLLYGRLGRLFCEATGFEPSQREVGTHRWWSVWSSGYEERNPYRFFWEMHPEVAEALEVLGWVTPESSLSVTFPDEVDETTVFREGAVCKVSVNAYERSPQARQRCIAHYGTSCFACGFNFGTVFGELGEGFIHVHHLCPISEIAEEYEVDPVKDLRPVCPNCHAMIHRRSPPLSIEEVQVLLSSSKVQPPPNNSGAAD
ncbi:HNH endonuclease [Leptolyngbya sp. O-77]|uniref:HNH endonuclease n=1 Tax=Leptolyngbya sp. O-77 TaxID=1080068 RepID=UPI00074D2C8C|nr:HNH endonuclease [Leptolyngbya sp. O-77]BAU44715.1 HNH endonuclease [Leptolyngbya sp. O-77]